MKRILLLLIVLVVPSLAWAEDIYIAQNPGSPSDGTSCARAYNSAFFNLLANWGISSGTINPGDTVHLCGTITVQLIAKGSGTSGSYITIYFEPDAKLSQPACPSSGCLSIASRSWIIVDGGTNGVIESTDNGTEKTNRLVAVGVGADTTSNIEIKNLIIQNMYVHTANAAGLADGTLAGSAALNNGISYNGSNIRIHHNTLHDCAWCIKTFWANGNTNVEIDHNTIYRTSHGWGAGGAGAISASDFRFHDNHVYEYNNWDTTSNAYHQDGVHMYSSSPGPSGSTAEVTNVAIYNNVFEGPCGDHMTGHIYLEPNVLTRWSVTGTARVYNNSMRCGVDAFPPNGMLIGGAGHIEFYNNTIVGGVLTAGTCVNLYAMTNTVFKNNAIEGCQQLLFLQAGVTFANEAADLNYNSYGLCTAGPCWRWVDRAIATTNFTTTWKNSCNCDNNSTSNASLMVNSSNVPQVGSPMIDSGTNLTLLGITALNSDLNSHTRPSSGNWTTGAYNYGFFSSARPTWFHFDQEFIDSNIGTATTTYPYFTGYKLWPQAAGSTPPVLAPATITALSPGGGSQTKYFMLHYPAAGGTTMANGLPSPAQNYFNSGQTRVNPLFSVINGNQTEMRNLTISSGSTTRVWWDTMPEWDGLGGYWLPTTVGLFESGTRAGNYTGFRTYVSANWTPLWTILQTAQATRGYWTASVAVWNANTHYIYEWGADMVLLERVIDSVGDLATGTAFIRGAGTQYNKPWGIDLSHYRVSAGSKGTTEFDQATGGLIGGWSTATTKRHLYLSYMAGPNDILSEAITLRYADTSLNPLGLTLQSFANFTVAHPTRGTTVVPIALLMDHDHGFVPRHWVFSDAPLSVKAVWYQKLAYNVGDHATNNLFVQLWPEHWRYGQTLGWNGGTTIVGSADWDAYGAWITGHDTRPYEPMPNSTYGDMFDVLLSDAPIEALRSYNVVMPIGNFVMTAGWRTMITDYATLGGTVVLNMSQVTAADEALLGVTLGSTTTSTSSKWGAESNLTESTYTYRIVTPTTATVIATNPANGNPLITMRTLGVGKVYFVAPNYMQDSGNAALLNISKRLLQDLTETYRQGWAEGTPVDFLTTQGTGFKTVTVANNSATTWSGNVKFKQAAPTSAVEWLTNTSLSYSVASGVTTMAVTVPAFDVRIFALTGGSTDTNPPASPTNVRVQ